MDTNTKSQINFLVKPLSILLVIVALFVLVLFFGMDQIKTVKQKLQSGKTTEQALAKKVGTLEKVQQVLAGDITFLDIVLPSRGASLYGLSQVKNQALANNLSVDSLRVSPPSSGKDGVSTTSIILEVTGEEQNVYNFLNSFSKLLPLMSVDRVSLNKASDSTVASVTLKVYSSEFPKTIPALTDPVTELTASEITLLKDLSSYQMPQFVEPSASTNNTVKPDPFN